MKKYLNILEALFLIGILLYSLIGTASRVDEIKKKAPLEMPSRGWEIMRYEGYQYGSWDKHGGICWYHVRNIENHNIQYRVRVSMWNGELQWYYGAPEKLSRFDIE